MSQVARVHYVHTQISRAIIKLATLIMLKILLVNKFLGINYEVQHGLAIHETPDLTS